MKIKVSAAEPEQLDWLVAKCEGYSPVYTAPDKQAGPLFLQKAAGITHLSELKFSTDWNQGGPIIDRERIATLCPVSGDFWDARDTKMFTMNPVYWRGPTPLIAAMRCYVVSKLGEEVEVPDELSSKLY
jgi:hypothetical protein